MLLMSAIREIKEDYPLESTLFQGPPGSFERKNSHPLEDLKSVQNLDDLSYSGRTIECRMSYSQKETLQSCEDQDASP